MVENYCQCPGCGECSAHATAPKLNAEIKRLKAQRQWVGLTADDVWQSNEVMALNAEMGLTMVQIMALMVWANAKLREKNGGAT
jgi:hypothetical protein